MAEVWSYSLEFRGEKLELEERMLMVGRSRTCDVPVKDPSVSRRHAELTPRGGRILLRDLGSSNGTFINGQRVAESGELTDGDTLGLGDADLEVRVTRDAVIEIPRMPSTEPAPPPAARAAGPPGEATGILQAASMRLAEEALDEASETDELPADDLPFPAATPGAHMAPLLPAPAAEPEPPAAEPEPSPELAASPMMTQAIRYAGPPHAGLPDLAGEPSPEPPSSPMMTQAIRYAGPPHAGLPDFDGEPPPEPPPSPMMTQAIPHAGLPDFDGEPSPEPPPSPMMTQAIPHAGLPDFDGEPSPEPPASPMMTQAIPHAGLPDLAGEPPPEPAPSPMMTQAIRHAGPPSLTAEPQDLGPPAPEAAASAAALPDLPAIDPLGSGLPELEPEPGTEKVHLAAPPPALEPVPEAFEMPEGPALPAFPEPIQPVEPLPKAEPPPLEPPQAGPVKDIREATLGSAPSAASGTEPLPPPSGGMGEILPSLDGFDTTIGPGVEVPESMQRARENMAKAQEAAGEPLADLYSRPIQLPPVAGFRIRALAVLADGVWIGLLELAGWQVQRLSGLAVAGAVSLLVILAGWSIWGTTPGKRLLSLYVCTDDGQAGLGVPRSILRLVAYLLSGLLLGAGFLMALSSTRRALHDRIAGTSVRRFH